MRKDAAVTRQRCIELAAEGKGPKAIGAELGVSDRTVRSHLNNPEAASELRRLQDERLKAITRRALATSETALDVLEAVALRGRVETARVMAAKAILDHGHKLIETADLAGRVAALEAQLSDTKTTTSKGVREWVS